MPLFKRSSDPTMSQQEFVTFLQGTQGYKDYVKNFQSAAAQAMTLCIYDSETKRKDAEGFWSGNVSLDEKAFQQAAPPGTALKFRNATAVQELKARAEGVLILDGIEFGRKKTYVQKMQTDATNGALSLKLKDQQEPETNYYGSKSWTSMTVQEKKAVWPPKSPGSNDELQKAKAWLRFTNTGPTALALLDSLPQNGTWPLGNDDSILQGVWKQVASSGAPMYRLPIQGKYPSSIGGRALVRLVMKDLASKAQSLKSNKSQDWALCAFGSIMAAQPFPDGNKRTARVAYAVVMASAGLPFKAPNNTFGANLAGMLGQ